MNGSPLVEYRRFKAHCALHPRRSAAVPRNFDHLSATNLRKLASEAKKTHLGSTQHSDNLSLFRGGP